MTLTDEQFAQRLRTRIAVAAPPMALDVDSTRRLGARRRQTRILGSAAGSTIGVAIVAVVLVLGLGAPGTHSSPAPGGRSARSVVQGAHPIGTGQVVQLAPGILASNSVVASTASDGTPWWSTGLHFQLSNANVQESIYFVGFMPLGQTSVEVNDNGVSTPFVDEGIVTAVDETPGKALHEWPAMLLRWTSTGTPDLASGGYSGENVVRVLLGTVPAAIPEPHVALVFPAGLTGADAAPTWVEVPTFQDPQGSGHLLFAVTVEPGGAWDVERKPQPQVFVIAGDGSRTTVGTQCDADAGARCLVAAAGAQTAAEITATLGATRANP